MDEGTICLIFFVIGGIIFLYWILSDDSVSTTDSSTTTSSPLLSNPKFEYIDCNECGKLNVFPKDSPRDKCYSCMSQLSGKSKNKDEYFVKDKNDDEAPCPSCRTMISEDAIMCYACGTKIDPTSNKKKGDSRNIAILGSSGSGKTVFFAMMSLVLNRPEYTDLKLEYQDGIGYIRDIREPLEEGEWPAKTFRDRKEVFSAVIYDHHSGGNKIHHLYMNDISGEDFTKYIGPDSDGKLPDHMQHIFDSSSLILVVSPETIKKDKWTFVSLMKYLVDAKGLDHGRKLDEKIAVVLSKHDSHREITDARSYIMKNAPDFYTSLEIRMDPKNVEFFLCSAVGDLTPEGKPRLPLAPVGIVEVIEWVLDKKVKGRPLPPPPRNPPRKRTV